MSLVKQSKASNYFAADAIEANTKLAIKNDEKDIFMHLSSLVSSF